MDNVFVSWALSDFHLNNSTYETMDISQLDNITSHQINIGHACDRDQLQISKNVLMANKTPVKLFSNAKKAKRVSFSKDISLNKSKF